MSEPERSPFARPTDDSTTPTPHSSAPTSSDPAPARRRAETVVDEPVRRRPRRRTHTGLWVGLVAALVAIAAVAAFVVRDRLTPTPPAPAGPGEVAQRYLTAIAAGDAVGAQALAAIKVDSPTFTNEAVAASMQAAPITDIRVESTVGQDVVLTYRRGDRAVRGTFPMVHVAEGWRVKRPTVRTRIAPQPQMIPPVLDGRKLESRAYTYDVELAPGTHRLSLPAGFLRFEQPEIVVAGLTDQVQVNARTATTPEYGPTLRTRLKERIDGCLKARELAPQGCPWAFRAAAGDRVDPASVRYRMDGDPFTRFTAPAPGTADAIVRGELRFTIKVAAKATTSGRTSTIDDEKLVVATYEADLLDPTLPFIWSE